MARIDVPQPRVEARGYPAGYAERSPDLGPVLQRGYAELAGSVKEAGHDLAAGYTEHKHKADLVAVNDQLNELQRGGTNEMYGNAQPTPGEAADAAFDERDPKEGYLAKKGKAAGEAGAPTYDRLEKRRQELLEGLQNDEQKRVFKEQSDRLLGQWYGQIEQHTFRENEQAKADSLKNSIDEGKRAAALNPADDKQAMNSIGRIVGMQDAFTTSTGDALEKQTQVQGEITAARLDSLLGKEGGFADAERIFKANRASLGTRADEYEKRIDSAKLGGRAAVAANQIVLKAGSSSSKPFAGPNVDKVDRELAKLAETDPKLYEKAAPIAHARIAMQRQALKEQKDQFVDTAVSVYNKNHAMFFSSPLADQLNQVDPDKYRDLWNETYHRAKAAGDDSPAERRAQAARDRLALRKYKAYGDGDVNARIGLKPETFVAGMNVSPEGLAAIEDAHASDVAGRDKGLEEGQKRFVGETRAALQHYAPQPGISKQSRAAARQWWADKTAAAVDAYTDWANDPKNAEKHAPSREEAAKLKAGVILDQPVDPSDPETLEANVKALTTLAAPPKPAPAELVPLVGPKGEKGKAPAAGLDAWLQAHPGWKKGP